MRRQAAAITKQAAGGSRADVVALCGSVVAGLRPFIDESIPRELVQMMR